MELSVVVAAREDDRPPTEVIDIAVAADRLGFRELWIGEGPTWDGFALATAIGRSVRQVSETAKNTTAEGADKGKEIAGIASDGRAQSDDRGSAGEHHGEPPVSAPNTGGTGTASDATDGHEQSAGAADQGTAAAEESSDGASSAGSGNSHGGG